MAESLKRIARFAFLILVSLVFPASSVFSEDWQEQERQRITQVEKTMQSVIAVFPAGGNGPVGGGSGVVISPDGYALTNFHVVQPCGIAMKCGMSDGVAYDAILVGLDPTGDIALIKLLGRDDFPCAPLGNSDAVRIGDEALVMGNPFMLAIDFKPCVAYGVISGTHRYQYPAGTFLEYSDCLQTDAAVNPGNSGGPLFNIRGELIGINGRCSFDKRGRVNVGIGYAVSINQIKYFLGDLKSGRIVDHAGLGAVVATDRIGRVVVDDVSLNSDLYRLGVRVDDEMVRFAGYPLDTANTFKNLLGIFPRDWRVPISIRTPQGDRHELLVRLEGLHSEAKLVEMTEEMMEPPIEKKRIEDRRQRTEEKDEEKDGVSSVDSTLSSILYPLTSDLEKQSVFIPDWAKPIYEKRKGFANYYFNRLELDRVLAQWRKTVAAQKPDRWILSGDVAQADSFEISIAENDVALKLPHTTLSWNPHEILDEDSKIDPISYFQEPVGSGGLFPAMYLMYKLATGEKPDFGEVLYVGTAPLDGNFDKLYDVVSVIWRIVRARFYFDPETGQLAMIEFYSMENRFPSEIRFRNQNGSLAEMDVRNGSTPFAKFVLRGQRTEDGEQNEPGPAVPTMLSNTTLSSTTSPVIDQVRQKIVKIYGAGGLRGMQGYQTGCLITPLGHILTVSSSVLEADPLVVILDNGRRYEASLIAADPTMEIAVLKIDVENLPCFDLKELYGISVKEDRPDALSDLSGFDDSIRIGDRIYAASNPYNIATGNEPVSFQQGIIAARTSLRARRGAFATTYKGPVYVVDAITNNPGAKGGAVVLRDSGRFVGLIGKELKNAENNTWFNFVLPGREVYEKVKAILMSEPVDQRKPSLIAITDKPELPPLPSDAERILRGLGIILVSNVANRTPPFIDSVRAGSEAEKLGLKPDDLIVMVNNRLTPSRGAVETQILAAENESPILLTVERKSELLEIKIR